MADDSSCRKDQKRAYITLVHEDAATNEQQNEVVIGDFVSETVVSRSALLSGMANTSGHASFPSGLKPEEVRLWEAACSIEYELPLDKLITVLKVRLRTHAPEPTHGHITLAPLESSGASGLQ